MGNPLTLYHNIKAACYSGNLSSSQAQKMQQDIAALGLTGKGFMAASLGGGVVTYIIYQIPYIGPLMSIIPGVVSVAAGIIGYDINTAANNLQEYANHRFLNTAKNMWNKAASYITNQKDVPEKQFAEDLINTASRNTLVIGTIYSYAIVVSSKHH